MSTLENLPENSVCLTLRVRYAETDQMQRAYYGRFFEWFEAARSEYCRTHKIRYMDLEEQGLFLPILEATCRYKGAARYDEEVHIYVYVKEIKKCMLRMGYRLFSEGREIAEGETLQMLINTEGKPRSFPPDIATKFVSLAE